MPTDQKVKQTACAEELSAIISHHCTGRIMSRSLITEVEDIVKQYCSLARKQQVKMPDLVVMPLVTGPGFEIVRSDLEQGGLIQLVRNIAIKYPHITPQAITDALLKAFPHLGKGTPLEEIVKTHLKARDQTVQKYAS